METASEECGWSGLEELRDTLRCFLGRHCLDQSEIDDVIQETYLRAARYRERLIRGRQLKPWTMRIAMNVLSDRKRLASRYVPVNREDGSLEVEPCVPSGFELQPPFTIGSHQVEKEDALGLMDRVWEELRSEDRTVLDAYYGRAQSCSETAEACEIPAQLVKIRLFRARRRLCRAMRRRLALDAMPSGRATVRMHAPDTVTTSPRAAR